MLPAWQRLPDHPPQHQGCSPRPPHARGRDATGAPGFAPADHPLLKVLQPPGWIFAHLKHSSLHSAKAKRMHFSHHQRTDTRIV